MFGDSFNRMHPVLFGDSSIHLFGNDSTNLFTDGSRDYFGTLQHIYLGTVQTDFMRIFIRVYKCVACVLESLMSADLIEFSILFA